MILSLGLHDSFTVFTDSCNILKSKTRFLSSQSFL